MPQVHRSVRIPNVTKQDVQLIRSASANLREWVSVRFPSPSSQPHYKTASQLLLLTLENFLQWLIYTEI